MVCAAECDDGIPVRTRNVNFKRRMDVFGSLGER